MANQKISFSLFVGVFVLMLIAPTVAFICSVDNFEVYKRIDYERPRESISIMKNYFVENFGFKSNFISVYKHIKVQKLNEPIFQNRIVQGKNGWYFLGNYNENLLDDSFGNKPITKEELFTITQKVKSIRSTLNSKGIEFILMVPPNKHRIYSENLPFQLIQNKTVLEQLKSHLSETIDFHILDLTEVMLKKKKIHQMYYKTNTHWTDIAAYYAYEYLMDAIEDKLDTRFPRPNLLDFRKVNRPLEESDLLDMLQLDIMEDVVYLKRRLPKNAEFVDKKNNYQHFKNANGSKKMLVYKDSFSNQTMSFLNESFAETWYTIDYKIDYDYIDKIKPDIVVIEIIERNLVYNLMNSKKPRE